MDYVEVFDSGVCVLEAREASLKVVWKCIYVDIIISKTNTCIYMPMCYCKSVFFRGKGIKHLNVSISAVFYEYYFALQSVQ